MQLELASLRKTTGLQNKPTKGGVTQKTSRINISVVQRVQSGEGSSASPQPISRAASARAAGSTSQEPQECQDNLTRTRQPSPRPRRSSSGRVDAAGHALLLPSIVLPGPALEQHSRACKSSGTEGTQPFPGLQ